VTARRLFLLRASGRLHGNVESACIEIERHAFFQGGTSMTRPLADSLAKQTGAGAGAGNTAGAPAPSRDSASVPLATL
jgi:cytoskeletal protein CcmA (bactofilin family)